MPVDSSGTFRHNSQSAAMHSKSSPVAAPADPDAPEQDESADSTQVHAHGDGTFHTVHGGEQVEHETIGHMHAHLSSLHGEPGEKHFHGHDNGLDKHSHSVETGGEPEHRQHEDSEGMKQHLGESMDGEPSEQAEPAMDASALGV